MTEENLKNKFPGQTLEWYQKMMKLLNSVAISLEVSNEAVLGISNILSVKKLDENIINKMNYLPNPMNKKKRTQMKQAKKYYLRRVSKVLIRTMNVIRTEIMHAEKALNNEIYKGLSSEQKWQQVYKYLEQSYLKHGLCYFWVTRDDIFTEVEIKTIMHFYRSPASKKILRILSVPHGADYIAPTPFGCGGIEIALASLKTRYEYLKESKKTVEILELKIKIR